MKSMKKYKPLQDFILGTKLADLFWLVPLHQSIWKSSFEDENLILFDMEYIHSYVQV